MKNDLILFIKGMAIGSANVIPGVSGGTIALITGVFERLIDALKSCNVTALRLLFNGKMRDFSLAIDMRFLIVLLLGVAVAILSLARILGFLFDHYPLYIWAFFFGLIMASVYYVGKTVTRWRWPALVAFGMGCLIALAITLVNPATGSDNFFYLMLCGVAGICSMILPGLSGSFVLILMGNYQLVVIDAVQHLDMIILSPVLIGAVLGLVAFSHLLSWVLHHYRDSTIALMTGFILGSLGILWPWKHAIYLRDATGKIILKKGQPIIASYDRFIPEQIDLETFIAGFLIIAGYAVISAMAIMEKDRASKSNPK